MENWGFTGSMFTNCSASTWVRPRTTHDICQSLIISLHRLLYEILENSQLSHTRETRNIYLDLSRDLFCSANTKWLELITSFLNSLWKSVYHGSCSGKHLHLSQRHCSNSALLGLVQLKWSWNNSCLAVVISFTSNPSHTLHPELRWSLKWHLG